MRGLLLCVLSLVLAGCAAGEASPGAPHNPGTLQWGVVGMSDIPTLDPALASDPVSISLTSLVYGGLVRLDRHLHVQPDGASRWTISPDGKVYTFYLRRHLRFADGRRVTAADVVAALKRALGPEGSSGTANFYLQLITHRSAFGNGHPVSQRGIEAVTPSIVRITLRRPAAHFLSELAFPPGEVPDPQVLTRYGPAWTDRAMGFGPYQVADWRHNRSLTLVPNPYYWGGHPKFRSITVHLDGAAGAIAAYRKGALDLISGWQPGETPAQGVSGLVRVPGLALDYLAFNTTRPPFNRLGVRRAFAAAWHPSPASRVVQRTGFPAPGLLPSPFGVASHPWRATRSPRAYLARAHHPQGHGIPTLSLALPRDPSIYPLAHALARTWEDTLGVPVVLRPLDSSTYSEVLAAHAYSMALVRWGADYPDPEDFLGTQLGDSTDNVTGWSSPAYTTAVRLGDSYAPTDSRRLALFQRAASLATQHLPILPLDVPALTAVIRPGLRGIWLTPLGTIVGDWTGSRAH